ncbi:MAG: hypothetical protein ACYTFA_17280 [Planctomycetota bacterium]|jgi:hypothetical protein
MTDAETFRIVLPYRGEFGHKIMWHASFINALPKPKIVFCEMGEECLYPDVTHYEIVKSPDEFSRLEWTEYDNDFIQRCRHHSIFSRWVSNVGGAMFCVPNIPGRSDTVRVEWVEPLPKHPENQDGLKPFVPEPYFRQNITCDVVVCPRKRSHPDQLCKNWPNWPRLVDALTPRYTVFAGGAPDSSDPEVNCPRAWDYDRFLDATVEAMLSAKVVVATDSGLAHLAVLCGRPLLLITHGAGEIAPGYRPGHGQVNLERYYRVNNAHCKSPILVLHRTWDDVPLIVQAVTTAVEYQ